MQEIIDSGGCTLSFHKSSRGVVMSGWGPRGADRGQVVLSKESLPELLAELDELARGGPGSGDLPARAISTSLAYRRIPILASAPHMPDDYSLLYLMGPNGGWRRPVRIYDRDTFASMSKTIADLLGTN